MERWEYAAGTLDTRSEGTNWNSQSDPNTTFERARLDLLNLMAAHGDEDWVIDPCVIKRSDRHPTWAKVHDHAAELLAEAMHEVALDFAVYGAGVMQGSDLAKVFKKVSYLISNKLPQDNQEYDG